MNEIFAVWQQYQLWIVIYSAIFSFSLIALLESNWPAFRAHSPTGKRWAINFGFWAMAWLVGLLLPVSMLVAANGAQESGWGVFNQFSLPLVVQIIAGFLAVDALHYSLHRALHEWGPLWRIHAVHHSDQDYDLTVGFRFHPLEAVLMFATRVLLVFALGLPVEVILIYEPLSLFFGMFAHGNMKLPRRMERIIRLLFVTPTMHCVHHSVDPREHNSNYGSIFSFWDRMFGSYTDKPHAGYEGLEFGIRSVSEASSLNLWGLLLQPFRPRGNW